MHIWINSHWCKSFSMHCYRVRCICVSSNFIPLRCAKSPPFLRNPARTVEWREKLPMENNYKKKKKKKIAMNIEFICLLGAVDGGVERHRDFHKALFRNLSSFLRLNTGSCTSFLKTLAEVPAIFRGGSLVGHRTYVYTAKDIEISTVALQEGKTWLQCCYCFAAWESMHCFWCTAHHHNENHQPKSPQTVLLPRHFLFSVSALKICCLVWCICCIDNCCIYSQKNHKHPGVYPQIN